MPDTTAPAAAPQEPTNVFDPPQGPEQPAEVPTEGTPTEQSGFLSRAGDAARGATARARTAAAGAAEGVAASIEKRAQIKDAQDRLNSAREVLDAEEAARREKLGRSGRAAEDSRRVAARLRGEPVPDVERSSRHTSAEKLHDEASAEIASIKSGDPAGATAAAEPFFEDPRAAVVEPPTEPYFPEDRQQRTDVDPFDGSAPTRARDADDQDDSATDDKFSHENSATSGSSNLSPKYQTALAQMQRNGAPADLSPKYQELLQTLARKAATTKQAKQAKARRRSSRQKEKPQPMGVPDVIIVQENIR